MLTLQRFKYIVCNKHGLTMTTHRVFVGLLVIGIEVAVARLNGARPPEPTYIPLRACRKKKEQN